MNNKNEKHMQFEMDSIKKYNRKRIAIKSIISVAVILVILVGVFVAILAAYGIIAFPIIKSAN
ncbi:hypothetical protein [Metamycoplasma cloacale]|nr:hypothetical protein [Metamycoplasma cloacale]